MKAKIKENGKEIVLPEGFTEEMYQAAKEKAAMGIKIVKCQSTPESTTNDLGIVIAVPDAFVTSQILKYKDENPKKSWEIGIENCVVYNKDKVLASDFTVITVGLIIKNLISIGQFEILN